LNLTRCGTLSQWSSSRMIRVNPRSYFCVPVTTEKHVTCRCPLSDHVFDLTLVLCRFQTLLILLIVLKLMYVVVCHLILMIYD